MTPPGAKMCIRDRLLGECKWGDGRVDRQTVRELIDGKGPLLRRELEDGDEWQFHYALFSRAGLTPAAAAELQRHDGLDVDLARLDAELY